MQTTEAQLFSCRYRNTYSILVAAVGYNQAKMIFELWLGEKGEKNVAIQHGDVKRRNRTETRPLYILA